MECGVTLLGIPCTRERYHAGLHQYDKYGSVTAEWKEWEFTVLNGDEWSGDVGRDYSDKVVSPGTGYTGYPPDYDLSRVGAHKERWPFTVVGVDDGV